MTIVRVNVGIVSVLAEGFEERPTRPAGLALQQAKALPGLSLLGIYCLVSSHSPGSTAMASAGTAEQKTLVLPENAFSWSLTEMKFRGFCWGG